MVLWKNMKSCDTDDVIPGKKLRYHVYRKIRRKYFWIKKKIQNISILVRVFAVKF